MSIPAQLLWRRLSGLLAALVLLCLVGAGSASALDLPLRWTLGDDRGGAWGLVLARQLDPDFPEGQRLRLNAQMGAAAADHGRPLVVENGLGAHWELANRSEELAPVGALNLPAGSAQFDLAGLQPAPQAFLPLRLHVPLAGADAAERVITLGPEVVEALHDLATSGPQAG